jgi:hypothetical protein
MQDARESRWVMGASLWCAETMRSSAHAPDTVLFQQFEPAHPTARVSRAPSLFASGWRDIGG